MLNSRRRRESILLLALAFMFHNANILTSQLRSLLRRPGRDLRRLRSPPRGLVFAAIVALMAFQGRLRACGAILLDRQLENAMATNRSRCRLRRMCQL
jgi:hypothetical protein